MIAMPTSEATRPNDASNAETSPKRTSKNSVQAARRGEAPRVRAISRALGSIPETAVMVNMVTMGKARTTNPITIPEGVNNKSAKPKGPRLDRKP